MATVQFTIRESRVTTIEVEVPDDLVDTDHAERRSANLKAMLHQPAEAILSGRDVQWSAPQLKITQVLGRIDDSSTWDDAYVEYAR